MKRKRITRLTRTDDDAMIQQERELKSELQNHGSRIAHRSTSSEKNDVALYRISSSALQVGSYFIGRFDDGCAHALTEATQKGSRVSSKRKETLEFHFDT